MNIKQESINEIPVSKKTKDKAQQRKELIEAKNEKLKESFSDKDKASKTKVRKEDDNKNVKVSKGKDTTKVKETKESELDKRDILNSVSYRSKPKSRKVSKFGPTTKLTQTQAWSVVSALDIPLNPVSALKLAKPSFTCDLCHKKFNCKTILKKHMESNHSQGSVLQPVSELDAGIALALQMSLAEKQDNKKETKVKETADPDWVPEKPVPEVKPTQVVTELFEVKKEIFDCNYCSNVYNSELKLVKHQTRRHWKKKRFHKYKCSICSVTFRFRSNLRSHMTEAHDNKIKTKKNDEEPQTVNKTVETSNTVVKKESIIETSSKANKEAKALAKINKEPKIKKKPSKSDKEEEKLSTVDLKEEAKKETNEIIPNSSENTDGCNMCEEFKTINSPRLRKHVKMHQKDLTQGESALEDAKLTEETSPLFESKPNQSQEDSTVPETSSENFDDLVVLTEDDETIENKEETKKTTDESTLKTEEVSKSEQAKPKPRTNVTFNCKVIQQDFDKE